MIARHREDWGADTATVVHALAVRGALPDLPIGTVHLLEAGLVAASEEGFVLTEVGYRCHRALVEQVLATGEDHALADTSAEVVPLARRAAELSRASARLAPEAGRDALTSELTGILDALGDAIAGAAVVPRFRAYLPRLRASSLALREARGAAELIVYARSAAGLCIELREDCLQTLGQGAEPEDY